VRVLAIVALAALAATGCTRDPLAKLKPREALEGGVALWQAGKLPEAERHLVAALEKGRRAELGSVDMRTYHDRVFQFYAVQGRLPDAERVFKGTQAMETGFYVNVRAANNMAVLYARAGRMAEAKGVIDVAYYTLRQTSVSNDRRPLSVVVLANLVRMSHAAGDDWTRHYQRELVELVKDIGRFQQSAFQPLAPGLKAVTDRQSEYLRSIGWEAEATALDATVAEIEARTPSTPGAPCVAYNDPAPLGCVLAF
jgi:hypothetical protein